MQVLCVPSDSLGNAKQRGSQANEYGQAGFPEIQLSEWHFKATGSRRSLPGSLFIQPTLLRKPFAKSQASHWGYLPVEPATLRRALLPRLVGKHRAGSIFYVRESVHAPQLLGHRRDFSSTSKYRRVHLKPRPNFPSYLRHR